MEHLPNRSNPRLPGQLWLYPLGIDHERLTFKHQGRRYRLTDVHGKVMQGLMA